MIIHSHRELTVWQKSTELVKEIYDITAKFPNAEIYGFISQMRRSSASIPYNIAEGRKRGTRKDFCKFLRYSYASGSELETQIELAKVLPFGKSLDYNKVDALLLEIMKMLNVMISKLRLPEAKKLTS